MSYNNNIVGLIVALALVFGLIGAFVSYNLEQANIKNFNKVDTGKDSIISVSSTSTKNSNEVIVNDRFVGKLDKNSKVVAVGKDGSMYVVKNGAVLVSDMIVKTNGEDTSVYRIDEPAKSVSTN